MRLMINVSGARFGTSQAHGSTLLSFTCERGLQ
jgi:hypothetical protein